MESWVFFEIVKKKACNQIGMRTALAPLIWKSCVVLNYIQWYWWKIATNYLDDYLRGEALAYLSCPASGSSPTASLDSTPFERVVATITKTSPSNESLLRDVMERSHRFIVSYVEWLNTWNRSSEGCRCFPDPFPPFPDRIAGYSVALVGSLLVREKRWQCELINQ